MEQTPLVDYDLLFRFEHVHPDNNQHQKGEESTFDYRWPQGQAALTSSKWPKGRKVKERYDLFIPSNASDGTYTIRLSLVSDGVEVPAYDRRLRPYNGMVVGDINVSTR